MSATVLLLVLAVTVLAALGRAATPTEAPATRRLLADVRSGARWLADHARPNPWVDR